MGGDPIPGPLDYLVKRFEAWKATLPKVKFIPRKRHVPNYIHGNLNRKGMRDD